MASESIESAEQTATFHGGRLIARRLKAHGVSKLFTLSGGHLFSIYDGCREEGIDIVDVRHESTAAFAAEGWAKVTRETGVCALTAGPGVTNGMSAMASAQANHSPMVVLGGRAPALRWGQGSLQEIDHVPFVRPVTKLASTPGSTAEIPGLLDDAFAVAAAPHCGPTFVDFPLDYVFMEAPEPEQGSAAAVAAPKGASGDAIERAAELLRGAERPVIMAGTDLYWGRGEEQLARFAETLGIPVFLNGLARGCLPADHELFFSRTRSQALQGADVALVIGVPMDFRLGFGGSFGEDTELIVIDSAEPERRHPRPDRGDAGRPARRCRGRAAAEPGLGGGTAGSRDRAPRGGEGRAERPARSASPDAPLCRARRGRRPRRDHHRRRGRLRLICRARGRQLRARLLA
jgi:acetolactate synthase I/II/III large subunit